MPTFEMVIDSISQYLTNTKNGQQHTLKRPLVNYNYTDTAKHYNFNIICGESTGIYRFKTCFYGLTDMPAEKAMDYTLVGLQNTYCFLDDIIIVSRESESDNLNYDTKCVKKLDEDNLRINQPKCQIAKTEINWLGYRFTQTGISTLENKTAAVLAISPPSTLRDAFLDQLTTLVNLYQIKHNFTTHLDHYLKYLPNSSRLK